MCQRKSNFFTQILICLKPSLINIQSRNDSVAIARFSSHRFNIHKYNLQINITLLLLDSWLFATYSIIISIIIIVVIVYNYEYYRVLLPETERMVYGDDSERPREENNNSTSTPASPGDVFEESQLTVLKY